MLTVWTVIGCASAPPPPGNAVPDDRGSLSRTAEADTIVDNGDGTWSYVLDPDFEPETRLFDGVITWRYDRQANMPYAPSTGGLGEQTFMYHDVPPTTPRQQLLATELRDPDGRVWVAEDVVARADLDIAAPYIPDPEALPDGERVQWTPTSWNSFDCDPLIGGDDNWVWNVEDREVVDPASSSRRKSIVMIDRADGWGTGVILRDGWVLTAAHNLWDPNTQTWVDYSDVTVVRLHDEATSDVLFWFIGPGFSGPSGWDPDDDYAIIHLLTPYTNADDMNISDADDAALDNVGTNFHRLGLDRWTGICAAHPYETSDLLHTNNNEITAHTANLIRWRGDGARGASGGPVFYCPENLVTECTGTEQGYVVAVHAGYSGYYNRFVGPRGSMFKSWAITLMDLYP